jgi:hypothetical protein
MVVFLRLKVPKFGEVLEVGEEEDDVGELERFKVEGCILLVQGGENRCSAAPIHLKSFSFDISCSVLSLKLGIQKLSE